MSWIKAILEDDLRREVVTSDTDMGYDLSLTTAYKHTTCISICSHPIPPLTFTSPDSGNGSTLRNWSAQWVSISPVQIILRKNIKHAAWLVFLNFSLFEPICPYQPNTTERVWKSPKCCVVFTALFIQDNMNATYKALENHVSQFCLTQNCQKVFVTHLWLRYTKVRYFILT